MRRVVTLFEVRGANQITATLGQMRGGFGSFRREMSESDRTMRKYGDTIGVVDKQIRALGTTLRYSVAGAAIFGGYQGVQNLNQIQQQLGLISAISPTAFGGVALVGQQLTDFGEAAEDAAYRALTPITEFNEGLVNLVSTVQDVPQNEVVPVLEAIAKSARLTMTPVQEATKGITGMLVAFGETTNVANVQRYLAQYQRAIFTVPGGAAAGPQIIQQLPQLAAVSRLAAVNPEQMFGLLNTVLRAGGTPATSARGLQYLIQGLAQPPSKEAGRALAGIGISPQFVQEQGGIAALLKLVEEIRRRGVTGAGPKGRRLRGLPQDLEDQLEGLSATDQLAGLGISGRGAVFAREAVGRIHGVRSLILLAAQEDQMLADLRAMANLGRNQADQVNELRGSWQRFEDKAQLHGVAMAIDQMAVDVAQVFEPFLNWSGGGVKSLRDIVDQHPTASVAAAGAGLTALMLRRRLGVGGLLRGFGGVMAVKDVAGSVGVDTARGDTPTNPVWVAVAYALSGPGAGGFFGRRGTTGPTGTGPVPAPSTRGRGFGRALGIGGGILAGAAGAAFWDEMVISPEVERRRSLGLLRYLRASHGGLTIPLGGVFGSPLQIGGGRPDPTAAESKILERLQKGYINEQSAERMLRRVATPSRLKEAGIQLRARGEVTVNIDGLPGGRKKATVPLELFSDFTTPAPTTRGKPKTYRGGN